MKPGNAAGAGHITASDAASVLRKYRDRIQAALEIEGKSETRPADASKQGSNETKGASKTAGASGLAHVVPVFLDALEVNLAEGGLPWAAYSYEDLGALANRRRKNRPTNARKAGELISSIVSRRPWSRPTPSAGGNRATGQTRNAPETPERELVFRKVAGETDLRLWIASAGSDKTVDSSRRRARLRVEFLQGGRVLEVLPPERSASLGPAPQGTMPPPPSDLVKQPFDRFVDDFRLLSAAAVQVRTLAPRFPGPEPFVFPDPPDASSYAVWATPPGKWRLRERPSGKAKIVLIFILVGAGSQIPRAAGAAYGHFKERTQRMLQSFDIGVRATCIEGRPVVVLSGAIGDATSPLIVLRDGRQIGRIDAADNRGAFEYRDTKVKGGETHVYAVGKELPFTREVITSGTYGVGPVPHCRANNQPPNVSDIQVTPARPAPGEPVHFRVSAVDPDGDPLTFDWSFGEHGRVETADHAEHVFANPGWYDVRLFVRDDHDGVADRGVRVGVAVLRSGNRPPVIHSILVGPTRARPGERVRFVALADDSDGDPLSYEWLISSDVFDPGHGRVIETSNAFLRPGTYPVSVRVSDTSLATVEAQTSIVVDGEATRPVRCESLLASPGLALKRGEVATFTPTGTSWQGAVVRLFWDFGDGTRFSRTGKGPGPERHAFARDGIYDVAVALRQADGEADVCTTRVTVGGVREKQGKLLVTGRVEPSTGPPETEFLFVAEPPGIETSGCTFQWTFTNFIDRKIVEVPPIASPRHRQRLPGEGLWTVRYVVILPDSNRRGPYEVADVEVSKR